MSFKFNSYSWNKLAETDPLWAILTDPEKKGNRWDTREFFELGLRDVEARIARIRDHVPEARLERAMDFGCGVGRLTQGLAAYFEEVVGVDVAPRMVELAEQFNRCGDRVSYTLNSKNDLRQFESDSFDLIFSLIALQHIDARDIEQYILEFLRVCKPGGVIYIQLPHSRIHWSGKKLTEGNPAWHTLIYRAATRSIRYLVRQAKEPLKYVRNVLLKRQTMIMTLFPRRRVESIISSRNADIVKVFESDIDGGHHLGYEYLIRKR